MQRFVVSGLAALLAIGGCTGGGLVSGGIPAGKYIGTLTCTMTSIRTDGVPVAPSTYPFGGSAEITSDGRIFVYEIEKYVGATTSGWMNGTYITDTVESMIVNDNNILINGPVMMTAGDVVATGSQNISIEQLGPGVLGMTHYLSVITTDGMFSMTQTCGGQLTQ